MVHKNVARFAAVMSSLAAALSLSAVVSPPASANWPNPEPGLTYHWSPTKTWAPEDSTDPQCQIRSGWAVVDSDTLRFKYQATCDKQAIFLGSEVYISRSNASGGTTDVLNGVAGGDNTNVCYQAKFCTTTYNFRNPAGAQTWYSTVRWAWLRWDNMSPWLRQTFSK